MIKKRIFLFSCPVPTLWNRILNWLAHMTDPVLAILVFFLCFERFYKFLCEKLVAKHHLKISFLNSRAVVLGFSLLHLSFASIIKFIWIVDLRKKFVYIYSKNSVSGCVSEKKITGGIIYFCSMISVFYPF